MKPSPAARSMSGSTMNAVRDAQFMSSNTVRPKLPNTARSSRSLIICAAFTILVLACEKNAETLAGQDAATNPNDAAINADAAIPDAATSAPDAGGLICAPGDPCPDTRCCEAGERCDDGTCRVDRRGPYCRQCTASTINNPLPCDDPRNFCLLGDTAQFCGVDCSLGQECPNGYECRNISILTTDPCSTTAECRCDRNQITTSTLTCAVDTPCTPNPGFTRCAISGEAECGGGVCLLQNGATDGSCSCRNDADCASGSTCVGGSCCGTVLRNDIDCLVAEGRAFGFCSCALDGDCPRDVCDSSRMTCLISGLPCTPAQNECPDIACVENACLLGRNCVPAAPATCEDLGG
jgi:hypothetical protein